MSDSDYGYMSGYMSFKTRAEARKEVKTMIGWKTKIISYIDFDFSTGEQQERYYIQCNHVNVLKKNGFVEYVGLNG